MAAPDVRLIVGPIVGDRIADRGHKRVIRAKIFRCRVSRFSRRASATLFHTSGRNGDRNMIRVSNLHKCYRNVDVART